MCDRVWLLCVERAAHGLWSARACVTEGAALQGSKDLPGLRLRPACASSLESQLCYDLRIPWALTECAVHYVGLLPARPRVVLGWGVLVRGSSL